MSEGYIKLHRQILESEVFQHPGILRLFIWLLLKTCYKSQSFQIKIGKGISTVTLKKGEMLFGRKKASQELNVPESTIRDWMKKLEEYGSISVESRRHYSTVTIKNWSFYQNNDYITDNNTTTNGQPSDTYKKDNKEKELVTYTDSFNEFWAAYPRKEGKSQAFEAWALGGIEESGLKDKVITAAHRYSQQKTGVDQQYIKMPQNWLKGRCWEDFDGVDNHNSVTTPCEIGAPNFLT